MVGARGRHFHPRRAAVHQAAGPVPQSVAEAAHGMGGRAGSGRAARFAGLRRGLTYSPMRVLLTGSSGWLGRFLAPRLRAAGHEVVGFDVAPGVETQVRGSVADRALVERVFAEHGIEAVVHAGAL